MIHRSCVKVSQYAAALTVAPEGMKSNRRMSFLSQKMKAVIFFTEIEVLNFWFWGNAYGAIALTVAWIQEWVKKPMFHLSSQWSPESHLLPVRSEGETSARNPSVSFCVRPLIFWAPSVRTLFSTLTFLSQLYELWSYRLLE